MQFKLTPTKIADWVVPVLVAGILDTMVSVRRDLDDLRIKVEVLQADVKNHEVDDDRERSETERRRERWMGVRARDQEHRHGDDAGAR